MLVYVAVIGVIGGLGAQVFSWLIDQAHHLFLHGIAGYDHAGMVWLGWVRRVLEEVSGRSVDAKQTGWGWQSPGPEEIVCEIRWS